MTEAQPDLLTTATHLLTAAGEKENGQAIAARNDVMRAQVYALLSIAASLQQLAANTTPPTVDVPEEPPVDVPADVPDEEPTTDAPDPDPDATSELPG